MYETHEQRAQLLAVKGVLLLSNVHFNLPGGNVIQQHTNELEKEPRREKETSERGKAEYNLSKVVNTRTNLANVSSGGAFCVSSLESCL